MTEAAVDAGIKRLLDRRGAWHVNVHGSGVGRNGIPDRLCCYRGHFIAIEVKQPGRKPTRLQAYELEAVRSAGGRAICATHPSDVQRVLDEIDHDIDPQEAPSA